MKLFKFFAAGGVLATSLFATGIASAEGIVARLSVHWGPKHHSAIHAKMYTDEVNKRAAGKLRIDLSQPGNFLAFANNWVL